MATTKATKNTGVRRQGRRVVPALRRQTEKAKAVATKVNLTLGDLIAAAFDSVSEAGDVARILSSRNMSRAIGKRIVCV